MRIIVQVKFYLFALFFVFSCTVHNPMQDYQKNNNKVRSEIPESSQNNQRNLGEQDLVNKTDPLLHCTELYGCYSQENDPQAIDKNKHCSELFGCYSEENDPQNKIICESPDYYWSTVCKETRKELIEKLEKSLDKVKFQCEDLGFKKGTEKFGECVLKLSE